MHTLLWVACSLRMMLLFAEIAVDFAMRQMQACSQEGCFLPSLRLLCRIYIAWSSKRFRERNFHIGIPLLLSGIGFM